MAGHRGKQRIEKILNSASGVTLVELLIASAILIVTVAGILMSYLHCLGLNEITKNFTTAIQAANNRMEIIKKTAFTQIKANYHNRPFPVAGLNGQGISYVNDTDPELLMIHVSVSWRQANGRLFGEDENVNGQLDPGEDKNGNGMLDSPVQLASAIFQRS